MAIFTNMLNAGWSLGGVRYESGQTFELSAEQMATSGAKHAIKAGYIAEKGKGGDIPVPTPKPNEVVKEPAVPYKDLPEATPEQIVLAVAALTLTNDDQFTKVGGIKVAALEVILQEQIGVATRTGKEAIAEATNNADRASLLADAETNGKGGGTGDNNGE